MGFDNAGTAKPITMANLRNAILGSVGIPTVCDNVMIAYARKSDGYVLYSKVEKWAALQNSGEQALGVFVKSGNQHFIIAPTEATSGLKWASATGTNIAGLTDITSKAGAADDYAGKANTAAILAGSTSAAVTNTDQYAAGFCNKYSRTFTFTQDGTQKTAGLGAGSWYLPSLGQLLIMYAFKNQINYALSLITGASALVEASCWSSTEFSAFTAWLLNFSTGIMGYSTKTSELRVRPVAALA